MQYYVALVEKKRCLKLSVLFFFLSSHRRHLEVQIRPFGAGNPAALQEREMSFLPSAHADERGRSHRGCAEGRPRSDRLRLFHRWDSAVRLAHTRPLLVEYYFMNKCHTDTQGHSIKPEEKKKLETVRGRDFLSLQQQQKIKTC